jgi:DNA invertase Pin-like site-specific DNA recombinase
MIRIYYRVSTDKQDFDMQEAGIRSMLKSKNIDYDSCVVYSDFGISGTTTQRPDYQRLLSEVTENDIIVVYEVSRLWRDMQEQSRVTKMLDALNVNILSVGEGNLNLSTSGDSLTIDIKGVVNQFEARRLKERSRQGIIALQSKVATGEAIWNGRGKDKQKRKNDGYKRRWEKYRQERINIE